MRPDHDWAYFFDIDGTLIDIAESPGAVRVDAAIQRLIVDLHRRAAGALALISGRALVDIDRLFPRMFLPAAGQHGVERRDARGRVHYHTFPSRRLDAVHRRLARAVETHPGLLLEHKGLSLALHYRRAPRLAGYAHRVARTMLGRLGARYCLQRGKAVVELRPAGKDKGVAIREFMLEKPFRGRTPVFVGDDATDEIGFAMVNRLGGHSIKVGRGPTVAAARLRNVKLVRAWLERALAPGGTS